MWKRTVPILLILLLAAFLRLWLLDSVPPGMTHDEADHGLDAWGVVQGIRPIYFPTAYGREPFFDYATAVLMRFLQPTILAGRLISVFFSLLMIAGMWAWTRRAFNENIALLTAAALTVNFWSLMTARHALRSVTMPALFVIAAWLFWKRMSPPTETEFFRKNSVSGRTTITITAGLLLGATFYTYIPSRITWLIFPCLLPIWLLFDRDKLKKHGLHLLAVITIAGAVGFPLFNHLRTTGAEARFDQLDGPLEQARAGDYDKLRENIVGGLKLFTITGDDGPISIRYNLPGRPILTPIMGILFYAGLLIALHAVLKKPEWRDGTAFAIAWLVAGLSPALITGPEAATTRAIAMQPVVFLFPALALHQAGAFALQQRQTAARWLPVIPILLFGYLAVDTARAYFDEWANHPDVRVQYETTRITTLEWLLENGNGAVAVSSPTPDRFHDPSLGLMVWGERSTISTGSGQAEIRWFNAYSSLILPDAEKTTVAVSGWADLDPLLHSYLDWRFPVEVIAMREDDLDRPIKIYMFDPQETIETIENRFTPANVLFGENVTLRGYELHQRNETELMVATFWRIEQPINELKLFTHVQRAADRPPYTQADQLDVPSFYWHPGDHFVQLHRLNLPESGDVLLTVGAYIEPQPGQFVRLTASENGTPIGDSLQITRLER